MQDDVKNNKIEQKGDTEKNTGISRRRFTQASMVTPIVMSLASRPVLGQGNQCTTSGLESGNHSGVEEIACQGCSPPRWLEQTTWPGGYVPGNGLGDGTQFLDVVGFSTSYDGMTLKKVLTHHGDEVGGEVVAAILNANAFGPDTLIKTFGYTESDVINLYQYWSGTASELIIKLKNLNDGGTYSIECPLSTASTASTA